MIKSTHYTFSRYLTAKRSVDDRALNRYVWDALAREIITLRPDHPLQILEIGAGIGTMIERVSEWGLLDRRADYLALDADADNIFEAKKRPRSDPLLNIAFETTDVNDFARDTRNHGRFDVLIAHAVMDLLDVPSILPDLMALVGDGGLLYMTINFDGATIFEPGIDQELDRQIEEEYHKTMDERIIRGKPSGDRYTGRHLFEHLRTNGASLVAAGSSDWVVFPTDNGYPADEAYFLHFTVNTMANALTDRSAIDSPRLSEWIKERHAQIERGELVYIAHQIDILAQR